MYSMKAFPYTSGPILTDSAKLLSTARRQRLLSSLFGLIAAACLTALLPSNVWGVLGGFALGGLAASFIVFNLICAERNVKKILADAEAAVNVWAEQQVREVPAWLDSLGLDFDGPDATVLNPSVSAELKVRREAKAFARAYMAKLFSPRIEAVNLPRNLYVFYEPGKPILSSEIATVMYSFEEQRFTVTVEKKSIKSSLTNVSNTDKL